MRSSSLGVAAAGLFAGLAAAGGASPPPAAADNARCNALGEGFFAVSGSDACIRISGYVAAGAEFEGGVRPAWRNPAPFDSGQSTALRTRTGVSADARFDTPMGPGRIYVQVGHDNFAP